MLKKLIFGMIALLLVTSSLFAGGTMEINLGYFYPSQYPNRTELYKYNKLDKKQIIWNETSSRKAYSGIAGYSIGREEPENDKNISGTDFYVCTVYKSKDARFIKRGLTEVATDKGYNDTISIELENGKTYYYSLIWYLNPKLELEDYYSVYVDNLKIVVDAQGTAYVYVNGDESLWDVERTATNLNFYTERNGSSVVSTENPYEETT